MSVYNSPLLDLSVFSNNMFNTSSSSSTSGSSGSGTITGVLAGTGLGGGGTSGSVSLSVDTTSIAQKSYVDTSTSNLVNGADPALNTLKELALALGNDENYATTITNSLAGKQDSLTFDTTATSGSSNVVTSGTIHSALGNKQDSNI